jgi:hypothetical protein
MVKMSKNQASMAPIAGPEALLFGFCRQAIEPFCEILPSSAENPAGVFTAGRPADYLSVPYIEGVPRLSQMAHQTSAPPRAAS